MFKYIRIIVISCCIILFSLAVACLFCFLLRKNPGLPEHIIKPKTLTPKDLLPFAAGERLTYNVFYKKVKVGTSTLVFHGKTNIEGREVYHITFSTDTALFKDHETIYAAIDDFLPFLIDRRIRQVANFPVRITERYDQISGIVTIEKQGKILSKKTTIEKETPIHNAILLPYMYRVEPLIVPGKKITIHLPTVSFDVFCSKIETVQTPAGEYSAYVFQSIPAKFMFWLSADDRRIPLKISSLDLLGYSLILTGIDSKKEQ